MIIDINNKIYNTDNEDDLYLIKLLLHEMVINGTLQDVAKDIDTVKITYKEMLK